MHEKHMEKSPRYFTMNILDGRKIGGFNHSNTSLFFFYTPKAIYFYVYSVAIECEDERKKQVISFELSQKLLKWNKTFVQRDLENSHLTNMQRENDLWLMKILWTHDDKEAENAEHQIVNSKNTHMLLAIR